MAALTRTSIGMYHAKKPNWRWVLTVKTNIYRDATGKFCAELTTSIARTYNGWRTSINSAVRSYESLDVLISSTEKVIERKRCLGFEYVTDTNLVQHFQWVLLYLFRQLIANNDIRCNEPSQLSSLGPEDDLII